MLVLAAAFTASAEAQVTGSPSRCATPATCTYNSLAPRLVLTVAGVPGYPGFEGNGGPAADARLNMPTGIAVDPAVRELYIVEAGNHAVRLVDLANDTISLAAGVLGSYGRMGYGAPPTLAQLNSPEGAYVDPVDRALYVADTGNHIIRRLNLKTGELTTIAGVLAFAGRLGDGGPATSAQLISPRGIALDGPARRLYVADTNNHAIRMVDLTTGLLTTVAGVLGSSGLLGDDTPANMTLLHFPYSVEVDRVASRLYITEPYNHIVRQVDLASGVLATIAGTPGVGGFSGDEGLATSGKLHFPWDVALDQQARQLYIADAGNHAVRMVDLVTGLIRTVAGGPHPEQGGPADQASEPARAVRLHYPAGVVVDPRARRLYVADRGNSAARTVDLATYAISTAVGTLGAYGSTGDDGLAASAKLHSPRGVALDPSSGDLYVADTSNHVVRHFDPFTGMIRTIAGVNCPIAYGPEHALQIPGRYMWPVTPAAVQWGDPADGNCSANESAGEALAVQLRFPSGVAVDPVSQHLYIADTGNHAVRRVDLSGNATGITTVVGLISSPGHAGDGAEATSAQLHSPVGLVMDSQGRRLFIADAGNHAVRLLDLASGRLSTVAGTLGARGYVGDDGPATSARLDQPSGLALDPGNQQLYVADTNNHVVRVLNLTSGVISRLAGVPRSGGHSGDGDPALSARLNFPASVAVAPAARQLFIADNFNHAVRQVDLTTGLITVVAGMLGSNGLKGDWGRAGWAQLHSPRGVAVDEHGRRVYIADASNHAVRLAALSNDVRERGAPPVSATQ